MSAGDQIAAAYTAISGEQPESESDCPVCGGDGWYVGHEDACYDSGDCQCEGVQLQCECQVQG